MDTSKLEHKPHLGARYEHGIGGKKIAVMGYSHHSDDEDHENFTTECVRKVTSGDWADISFFKQIASYFGSDHKAFWPSVAFLNFLPRKIGVSSERFAHGSAEASADGRARAMAFLERHKPDYLFVFSQKAWRSLPKTTEEERNQAGDELVKGEQFRRHHYTLSDGHVVQAVGLRHPQGARKDLMAEAVASGLSMQPNPPS